MQKNLIVLAIASALAAPVLSFAAETSIYGAVDVSANSINSGGTNSSTSKTLVSNNSFVGFKGSEAMDGGLNAIWQLEGTVDAAGTSTNGIQTMNNGANTGITTAQKTNLFNRNTYIGLKSDSLGTVLAGRHDTPYKIATRSLDVFANNEIGDNRDLMGGGYKYSHDARLSDVVAYISPNLSGVTIAAGYVGKNNDNTQLTGKNAVSLAAMYGAGPLNASLAYQSVSATAVGATPSWTYSAFKIGGGYTMDALTVNAVFESLSDTGTILYAANTVGTSVTRSNIYLAAKYNLGAGTVKAAYTSRGTTSNAGSANDATKFVVGYDHALSKVTTVYALYAAITNNSAVGANPSAVSIGLKHSF
ncbi:MAG: porin [Nitrosomonadales bacterium]|nr:porin [Nitrosomonadales bacterium]